ncbi:metallophosphoesterase [Rapidithrix thailandica]|uniref:Metallophosphoesterase n=1 Tax=Rapidithrix thailandica TaxID=413964 RepID=A0AAW9SG64_9BACT
MKIQYCSDLHLEFPDNRTWLDQNPLVPKADLLIIAGDTYHLGRDFDKHPYFDVLSHAFEQVFLIPGNHEYYSGYNVENSEGEMDIALRHNVHLVNNKELVIEDTHLIFTTLWSRIQKEPWEVLRGLLDFQRIQFRGKLLSLDTYNYLHDHALLFLKNALKNKETKKQVVITHHLPSHFCNVEEFRNSPLNEGFCVDLTSLIEASSADVWIYGHSHRNVPKFEINGTRMLTNQLGYVGLEEHQTFNREAWVQV